MLAMPEQEYIKYLYEKEECSIAEISAKLGINWRTAAKYAKKDNWNEVCAASRRCQPVMDAVAEVIDMWLMEDRLKPRKERRTAAAIYRQLKDQYDFTGSERTVRHYVSLRKKGLRARVQEKFLQLEHPPGQAQVDFGTTHVIFNGELCQIKYLMASFPYSNAGFCVPVPGENAACFLHALIQIFERTGGVPQRIRFDNLSAAVVRIGKGQERTLTDIFRRFMLHYRFMAEFCNGGKGNEKGHVENKIGYSRRNWLVPYPEVSGYEELTEVLFQRAYADMQRNHYQKGMSIAELWEEEKKHLLPLPTIPFEPVQLDTARVNKYCQINCQGETYAVPRAEVGELVLLKLWWDRVEIFNHAQELLTTLPRHYTLKTQPIDWEGYFAIFVRKPRGAKHAVMYRFLPHPVHTYLEEGPTHEYKERLGFIHTLLQEGFSMEDIGQVLSEVSRVPAADTALIRHMLYRRAGSGEPLKPLDESYTPGSVRQYTPQPHAYDRLIPRPQEQGGETSGSFALEGAV